MASVEEMVMCSNTKHLTREALIARFEPHLYPMDVSYRNVNEVYLPVSVKNHWTLYVYDLQNKRIQLLDSRLRRRRSCMSGIQHNLAKVVLWLATHKKEVLDIDLKMFSFMTPNVLAQPNDHNYRIFIMKFMDYWSMGGFSKSIDVGKLKKYRLKIMGILLFST
ncbi:hypothetical protein VitviT2T_016023 [Vitis vinifera]|uniref:Ubiquitin-like protease family profile domain-containing protein n=1 Tax=Vitis vinifera TaxID=29760 RepID=A0ABY9CRV4_VITVI|nr:hypothetical protein VitviT2T_016023 [Vitis vinifera]